MLTIEGFQGMCYPALTLLHIVLEESLPLRMPLQLGCNQVNMGAGKLRDPAVDIKSDMPST